MEALRHYGHLFRLRLVEAGRGSLSAARWDRRIGSGRKMMFGARIYIRNFMYSDAMSRSFVVVLTFSLRLIRETTLATVR